MLIEQLLALDSPRKMMHAASGGQDGGAARSEGQADQTVSADDKRSLGIRSEFHDAPAAGEGSGDVKISFSIEGHALRAAQPAIEDADGSMLIDAINGIEAGGGGARNVQNAIGAKGEMIGGDA